MKVARCTLRSAAPYSQSRMHNEPKKEGESPNDYELRTWPHHMHVDRKSGRCYIPSIQFKKSLDSAAKYLGKKIQGRGNATWTKHFEAGIMMAEPVVGLDLGVTPEEVEGETFAMNADGKRGSGTRVPRTYPVFPEWEGVVTFYILDPTITESVFREHLECAGKFRGIGRWRPEVGGQYGRFVVKRIDWNEMEDSEAFES